MIWYYNYPCDYFMDMPIIIHSNRPLQLQNRQIHLTVVFIFVWYVCMAWYTVDIAS